jgi:hypothetical protein
MRAIRYAALSLLFLSSFAQAKPLALTFPLSESQVACTEQQLERVQRRMASVGSGQIFGSLGTVAVWTRGAKGSYSGLARLREPDSLNDFVAGIEHFREADMAFDLFFTRNGLLDPHSAPTLQGTLVRRDSGTNLVLDHTVAGNEGGPGCCMSVDPEPVCVFDLTCPQILNFDLSAVPGDSVRPVMPLVINNAAAATPAFSGLSAQLLPAASGSGPGINADALDASCGGTLTDFDLHVFEILARTLAPSACYLLGEGALDCGLEGYNIALFRGTDPHTYRANIYVEQYLCDPPFGCFSTGFGVALEFQVNWDNMGHLTTGEVTVLPNWVVPMGVFLLPPIYPGHGREGPQAFHGAPYLSITPTQKDQIFKASINWAALLANSGLNSP